MNFALLIYCLIQGATEFLPISSQGHLIFFNHHFPIATENLLIRDLNIIAHSGSLLAVIIYYHKEVLRLALSIPNFFRSDLDSYVDLLKNLMISSIPIYFCGYFISYFINDAFFESLLLIGWTTVIFGIILFIVDKNCLRIKNIESLPNISAFYIGLVQCLAIIPGVSRSGSVLTIMRLFGYTRLESANYSNLLSIPVILGALMYLIISKDTGNGYVENIFNLKTTMIFFTSFIFSYFFIHFMITWVKKSSFAIFMYYRIIIGILILIFTYFDLFNIS